MRPSISPEMATLISAAAATAARAAIDEAVGRAVTEALATAGVAKPPHPCSIPEATKLIGLSRSSIYREIEAGKIKAKKAGARVIIMSDEIARYMNELPTL